MVCTIFKSAGIHVIGLTLFYLTIACLYEATQSHCIFSNNKYNADSSKAGTVPVSNQKIKTRNCSNHMVLSKGVWCCEGAN